MLCGSFTFGRYPLFNCLTRWLEGKQVWENIAYSYTLGTAEGTVAQLSQNKINTDIFILVRVIF